MRTRHARLGLVVLILAMGTSGLVHAQFRGFRGLEILGGGSGFAPAEFPDRKFALCRLAYRQGRRFAGGWRTDYPLGERNLSIRFSELTRTRVSMGADRSPNHYVVRLTDDQLFQCPILMAGDIGSIDINPEEALRLRAYLLKGGFLWTDDMWGPDQWAAWTRELAKVLDPAEYPIEDVPISDPVFQGQFIVERMPQIPNIQHWRSSGTTSEQGAASAVPVFRAVRDREGRIMVAMMHNTDIADAFEREGEDPDYFYNFSPTGYALGVNILLYALTH
ncbi:MAG: DUF4159 domain-containing protein [Vicinamibacterales bacterium]